MRSAKLYRYSLPMDSGVILRDEKLTVRKGFVVELSENGKTGLGEIAPLKGFSVESPDEAGALAKEHLELWVQGNEFNYQEMFPSVAFATLSRYGKLTRMPLSSLFITVLSRLSN